MSEFKMQVEVNGEIESRPFTIQRERNFDTGEYDDRMSPELREGEEAIQLVSGRTVIIKVR